VIDIISYDERGNNKYSEEQKRAERFKREDWIIWDLCNYNKPWPFKNKEFDFVVCSHLLEDIRDPVWVCREMMRVGKRGYIETPSREAESKMGIGGKWKIHRKVVGYSHHRWFVELIDNKLVFTPKPGMIQGIRAFQVREVNKDFLEFFWEDVFDYKEILYLTIDQTIKNLLDFKLKNEKSYWGKRILIDKVNSLKKVSVLRRVLFKFNLLNVFKKWEKRKKI